MEHKIPQIVEDLYLDLVPDTNPEFWPDYLKNNPARGHGLWSFYQGLQIGLQLGSACLEEH